MMAWEVERARLTNWNDSGHLEGLGEDSQGKERNTEPSKEREEVFEI